MYRPLLVLIALLVVPFGNAALANPSSSVAWTPPTKQLVDGGDPASGRDLGAVEPEDVDSCADCHGDAGAEPGRAKYPMLAGQLPTYTYKQLQDYKNRSRQHRKMYKAVRALSNQQLADLAAWYGKQPLPVPESDEPVEVSPSTLELVFRGDMKRMIVPCASCHGLEGEGALMDVPALAGQGSRYLAETMKAYKDGERRNDIYSVMRDIARVLTLDEIKDLAAYYANLGRS